VEQQFFASKLVASQKQKSTETLPKDRKVEEIIANSLPE